MRRPIVLAGPLVAATLALTGAASAASRAAANPDVLRLGEPLASEITDAEPVVTTPTLGAGYTDAPVVGRTFALAIEAPGTYRVELRSHAFDGYLVLREADGSVRAEDDDGLLATHPVVVFEVGAAEMAGGAGPALTVDACALHGGRGAFELLLEQGAPPVLDGRARVEAEIEDLRLGIAAREAALGPDDPQLANPLNELALRHKQLGDYAAARPLYERSLALFEKGNGLDSVEVAVVSNNLGGVLINLGDYAGAKAVAERAVGIIERLAGPDDPAVAPYLNMLAEALRLNGEFAAAAPLYERALKLAEAGSGPDSPEVCQTLNNFGLFRMQHGDGRAAKEMFERALGIAERLAGPDHPYTATPLINLGSVEVTLGEYTSARQHLERALTILERAVGPQSAELAEVLNSLAQLHEATGDYAQARTDQERILHLLEAALGPNNPTVAMALNNLASAMIDTGELAAALPLAERALAIREQQLSPTHPDVAQSLQTLGLLAHSLGDTAAARGDYERALKIWEASYGPEHSLVAQTLNNLGTLLIDTPQRDEARALLERSLAIREKTLDPKHPAIAESLGNLGAMLIQQGDLAGAQERLERAVAILEASAGKDHPSIASHLHNLAGVKSQAGDREGAIALFARALEIRERLLGTSHPLVALSQLEVAELELDGGDVGAAVAWLERAEAARAQDLARFMAGASEAEASLYTASIRTHIELGQSAPMRQARPVASAESLLAWKGQVLRAAREGRAALRQALGEEGRKLADRLEQVSAALSRQATALAQGEAPATAAQLDALIGERQRLERELAPLAARALPAPPRWTEVRDALPEHTLLFDVIVHQEYEPLAAASKAPRGVWSAPRITAWATRRGMSEPVAVDLGPAAVLEAAVRDARSDVEHARGVPLAAPKTPRAAVEPLVLEPLRPLLDGVDTVFVSPDGVLATLPLETLRDADGRYLVESRGFVYLTDPTELARPAGRPAAAVPTLLALGAVDFDAAAGGAGGGTAGGAAGGASGGAPSLRGAMAMPWQPLAATRAEVDGALAVHAAAFAGAERLSLTGADATEDALVEQLPRHSVLHLATHGFFQPERMGSLEAAAALDVQDGQRGGSLGGLDEDFRGAVQRLQGYSPGLLSGLVCTGANADLAADRDDGYLTAEEVGWLDLTGADLVVLSACDTGLGRPQSGEGLLGLRRAFLTAGAHTVISSLWSVPDQETAELMGLFYENLWQKQLGKHESLRAAQLEMIKRNRERFGGDARPVTWGAFVLDGDWR